MICKSTYISFSMKDISRYW